MENNFVKRTFIPGDEWVYYKIYCGFNITESILKNIVYPVANQLINDGHVSKWFFIRYSDPKPHLRLRFQVISNTSVYGVIRKLTESFDELVKTELVWKIQLDTYQREVERYGTSTIEISEELFFHDSNLIIKLIDQSIKEDENKRWLISLVLIDNILTNFKYSITEKLNFMEKIRNSFAAEFNTDKFLTKQLDSKYRQNKIKIDNFIQAKEHSEIYLYSSVQEFNQQTLPIYNTIITKKYMNELDVQFDSLVSSYIHMCMVRLFKSKNRLHELVVYDFMLKYYKTQNYRK